MPRVCTTAQALASTISYRLKHMIGYGYVRDSRDLMTIGIGVLASEETKPDRLIFMADTMGSYEDSFSTSELHKIHAIEAEDLYAVSAGSLTDASELINMILKQLRAQPTPRRYPEILHALNVAANVHRMLRFGLDCLPSYGMTGDDWLK